MAIISKGELVAYAKRKLGDPVVQINVTDAQIEDCLEQTFERWWHHHPDGLEKMYLKHKVTGTKITVTNAAVFVVGQNISKTGVVAEILAINSNELTTSFQNGTARFEVGDTVIGQTGTTQITNIVLGDIDNRWVPTSDLIYGVTRILPFSGAGGQSSSRMLFDLQYQLRLSSLFDLTSTSLAYYTGAMTHLAMLDQMLNGPNMFRFNRLTNKLYIEASWGAEVRVDDYIIAECYRVTDPETNHRAYGDPFVKSYLIATIKQQWGTNLKKYQGVQLLGGITIDGQGMFDEASQELKDLEDDLIQNGPPLEFFAG